ncbi:MAG: AMIN domain-containing protein, partial [Nitrospirae bacterium]
MKRKLIIVLVSLVFLISCASGKRAEKPVNQDISAPPVTAELKSIESTNTEVKITATAGFEYTITQPSDPFKLTIILNGVQRGSIPERLTYESGLVSEVQITEQDQPVKGLILDMTLSEPADLEPQYLAGVLTLTKKGAVNTDEVPAESASSSLTEETTETPETVSETPTVPAQYIEDISMQRRGKNVVVSLKADGAIHPEVFTLKDRLVIDIPNVAMRATPPEEVAKPLKGIRWAEHADRTRVVLDLEPGAIFDVRAIGDTLEVVLSTAEVPGETLFVEEQTQKAAPVEKAEGKA